MFQKYRFRCPETGCFPSDQLAIKSQHYERRSEKILYPQISDSHKRLPDYQHIRKELMRNGVTKKLLWAEYVNECQMAGDDPLMYSQFCYYVQQDEEKHRATMHINRKPGEQVEVDWAGDPAHITDPVTGEIKNAYVFVGVMSYSQYTYAEAFLDEKQDSWTRAHVHMMQFLGGVPKILVPDNTKTAVVHNHNWNDQELNRSYHELAEYYGTAVIPARVRHPKDIKSRNIIRKQHGNNFINIETKKFYVILIVLCLERGVKIERFDTY